MSTISAPAPVKIARQASLSELGTAFPFDADTITVLDRLTGIARSGHLNSYGGGFILCWLEHGEKRICSVRPSAPLPLAWHCERDRVDARQVASIWGAYGVRYYRIGFYSKRNSWGAETPDGWCSAESPDEAKQICKEHAEERRRRYALCEQAVKEAAVK